MPRGKTTGAASTLVTVRLTEGPLAALDQMVGEGPGRFPSRSQAAAVLMMRGFEDVVQNRRRMTTSPDERPYNLTVGMTFTEAEAEALSCLATLLQGGSASQPLVTALNKVRRDLDFARSYYRGKVSGRAIGFPDPPGMPALPDGTSQETGP